MDAIEQGKCSEVSALLSEYLNLELPADACRDVESHLSGCESCGEFAESLRKTVELCHAYLPSAMPEPISSRAREELMGAYKRMLAARQR